MREKMKVELNTNEKVAVFISVAFVFFLFVVPLFGLVEYTPSTQQTIPQVFSETSELRVYELRNGSGVRARLGDTLTVHYEGRLLNGTVVDASYGGSPFTFILGMNEVIQGWEEGLRGMQEGAIRVLVIPAELGYGNRAVDLVPKDSTLIFEVELLDIEQTSIE